MKKRWFARKKVRGSDAKFFWHPALMEKDLLQLKKLRILDEETVLALLHHFLQKWNRN